MADALRQAFGGEAADGVKTGIACLAFVLAERRVPVPAFPLDAGEAETVDAGNAAHPAAARALARLSASAAVAGLDLRLSTVTLADLAGREGKDLRVAALAAGTFVVICGRSVAADGSLEKVFVFDPLSRTRDRMLWVAADTFAKAWSGEVLEIVGAPVKPAAVEEARPAAADPDLAATAAPRFGFAWFAGYLRQNRALFRDVAVISLFIHLLSIAPPVFFQIVVDRVLVHQVFETLVALAAGVAIAIVFGAIFDYARERILLHAANRIDASIGPATFAHLTSLPLTYFDPRPVGVLVKHMQQAEPIREFLAGRLLVTLLNASILVVIVPLLFAYNSVLATMTLAIAALLLGGVLALIVPLRRRLTELYVREGGRQAMLVEALQGIATVKSLGLEPARRAEWDLATAGSIDARYRVQRLQITVRTLLSFFEQGLLVAIVVVGALFVIDGRMSVGALIAFQMLAGRVTGPLLELIGLTHQIQETALSVKMLGNVMNAPAEQADGAPRSRPPLGGAVAFDHVSFRYPGSRAPALENLSLRVAPGEFVGIVGRSGSGKTTLTRLMLGHYPPQSGAIAFGGANIRDIDLPHLRQHFGIVLQDTFLFSGSVAANIAASNPLAGLAEIEAAAEAAGAAEFIERLPDRYETRLEEGGRNLSGGQRQRLGLARALLVPRPFLVLDEATSALDPESEASIRARLPVIRKGRTVILVSHKLSLLTEADRIVVLERGHKIQEGSHADLVRQPGLYAQLWRQQAEPYQPRQAGSRL